MGKRSIFRTQTVQEQICRYLNFEEAVQYLAMFRTSTIDCPISVFDPIYRRILVFPGVNPDTILTYRLISKFGTNGALRIAAANGFDSILNILLESVHPDTVDENDQIVEELIHSQLPGEFNFETYAFSQCEDSALLLATENNQVSTVNLLIGYGANLNQAGANGETPLIIASQHGFIPIVEILLRNGANVNAQNNNQSTALIHAVVQGHAQIVAKLLKAGADFRIRDKWNKTALAWARSSRNNEIEDLLINAGAIN